MKHDLQCFSDNVKEEYISNKIYNTNKQHKIDVFLPGFDILFYLSLISINTYKQSVFLTKLLYKVSKVIFSTKCTNINVLVLFIKNNIIYNKDALCRPYFFAAKKDLSKIIMKCITEHFSKTPNSSYTQVCNYTKQLQKFKCISRKYNSQMKKEKDLIFGKLQKLK